MEKNGLVEIESISEVEQDIVNYRIVDNKLIVITTCEQYSLNYNLDNELEVYNRTNNYLNNLYSKLTHIEGNRKLFGYVCIFFTLLAAAFGSIAYFALSIMPMFVALTTLCVACGTFGIAYIMKCISLEKEYIVIKSEYRKLKSFLKFRKIDINFKVYERQKQESQFEEKNLELIEVPLEELDVLDFENLDIEQLKQLSAACGGKESENKPVKSGGKRQKLV